MPERDSIDMLQGSAMDLPPTQERMDSEAAAELAQEITLVAQALFAQLLPETARAAVTGVPGLGGAPVTSPLSVVPPIPASTTRIGASDPPEVAASAVPLPLPELLAVPDAVSAVPVPATLPVVPAEQVAAVPPLPVPSAPVLAEPVLSAPVLSAPVLSAPVPSVTAPSVTAPSVTAPSVTAPSATGPSVPIPSLPLPDMPAAVPVPATATDDEDDDETTNADGPRSDPEADREDEPRNRQHSMAMLREIGFLDE